MDNEIPLIHFERGERKDDRANRMRRERDVRGDVVFIGVAQEKAKTYSGRKVPEKGPTWFDYSRDKTVCVNHYYFYVDDEEFGPALVKVCSYPVVAKLRGCLHRKRFATRPSLQVFPAAGGVHPRWNPEAETWKAPNACSAKL